MVTAIIAAAGQGKRMGRGINKVFIPLSHCPVLVHSVRKFSECQGIDNLVIVTASQETEKVKKVLERIEGLKPWRVAAGGTERQYSIANALAVVEPDADIILVHDGARPLIECETIEAVIDAARKYDAAVVAVPVKDTIKQVDESGFVTDTPDRKVLWSVQTPQAFSGQLLRTAYDLAAKEGFLGTDDAGLVERLGVKVKIVSGNYQNIKITTPEDMLVAAALLEQRREAKMTRVGTGYDVHRLVEGRRLILGGVEIPYSHGLLGHSDADVLLHAVKDALLGAAALGDIGRHFPDNDIRYQGASSLMLLGKVKEIIGSHGFAVHNVDATIVAQRPKLAGYIEEMNANIARTLGIPVGYVNVKATTTEGLGFTGRGEGIAAHAVATLINIE